MIRNGGPYAVPYKAQRFGSRILPAFMAEWWRADDVTVCRRALVGTTHGDHCCFGLTARNEIRERLAAREPEEIYSVRLSLHRVTLSGKFRAPGLHN